MIDDVPVLDHDLEDRVRTLAMRARALRDEERPFGAGLPHDLTEELAVAAVDLQAALRRPGATDAAAIARACRDLVDVTRLQGELREQVVAGRFGTVARIHDSLSRLRSATTVAELLPAAAEELGRSCGFDRAVISRRRGSTWQAEAIWLVPGTDAAVERATRAYLTEHWMPLAPGTVESHLVQRRSASLVSADDPGVDRRMIDAVSGLSYVASPVMSSDRVIGFLHADRLGVDRTVDEVDRDNLWTFPEGFGLVFERVALLERLGGRRARVREAFAAAEEGLAALGEDELLLARQELGPTEPDARGRGGAAEDGAARILTAREREVVDLMATGARNREIAERLVIGEATVKSHVRAIGRKLEATGRADAVARYLRLAAEGGS